MPAARAAICCFARSSTHRNRRREPSPWLLRPIHYLAAPTPGRSNSSTISPGPRILSVAHRPSPEQPLAEPIVVTAKVAPLKERWRRCACVIASCSGAKRSWRCMTTASTRTEPPATACTARRFPPKWQGRGKSFAIACSPKMSWQRVRGGRSSRIGASYSGYRGTVIADPSIQSRLPVIHLFSSNEGEADGLERRPRGGDVLSRRALR